MSRTETKWIRIAPGCYRVGEKLIAQARVGNSRGDQQRLRKVFDLGTSIKTMQAWRHDVIGDALDAAPVAPAQGTLAADIPLHLATLPIGRYRYDSEQIFKHWLASPLSAKPRSEITRSEIKSQISRWLEAPHNVAPATCNRRLSRLRALYHERDGGPDIPNPTDTITYERPPEAEPRDIPIPIVQLILSAMPDLGRADRHGTRPTVSQTKLRLTVIAWTGIPPATLQKITIRDLDLDGGRIRFSRRNKGGGVTSIWVALLPQAVDALRAFVAAGLLGKSWARSSVRHSWTRAIARAKKIAARHAADTGDQTWADGLAKLPPRCKPYDLRHSFGSEIYRLTGDLRAVAELLHHSDLETTKRYTKGAVSERVDAAIAKSAEHLKTIPSITDRPGTKRKSTLLRMVRPGTS